MLEWLKTILGDAYDEDIDKKVSAEVGKAFVARADFNALNDAKKGLEEAVKDRDKQMDELKKVDPAELQNQIKKLQDDNAAAQKAYDDQVKQLKIDSLLESRLLKEGAVNTKAVRALLDASKIAIDGENLVGIDDQLTKLKETEKWAFSPAPAGGKSGGRQGGPPPTGETGTMADEILGSMFGKSE